MILSEFIAKQMAFSHKNFGGGRQTKRIIDHIKKELKEVEDDPDSLEECCDGILLSLDLAWRAGHTPIEIEMALERKLKKNIARKWSKPTKNFAVEHIRDGLEKNDG